MGFKFSIGGSAAGEPIVNSHQLIELIPVPVNQDTDLEFCFACRTVKDVFWNGKINICISCDKGKAVARKMGIPLVDEGIPLEEFFKRLEIREEIYGGES